MLMLRGQRPASLVVWDGWHFDAYQGAGEPVQKRVRVVSASFRQPAARLRSRRPKSYGLPANAVVARRRDCGHSLAERDFAGHGAAPCSRGSVSAEA